MQRTYHKPRPFWCPVSGGSISAARFWRVLAHINGGPLTAAETAKAEPLVYKGLLLRHVADALFDPELVAAYFAPTAAA